MVNEFKRRGFPQKTPKYEGRKDEFCEASPKKTPKTQTSKCESLWGTQITQKTQNLKGELVPPPLGMPPPTLLQVVQTVIRNRTRGGGAEPAQSGIL